jgi:hypothetical protein
MIKYKKQDRKQDIKKVRVKSYFYGRFPSDARYLSTLAPLALRHILGVPC